MNTQIRLAVTGEDIARCFAVMHELRPHLTRGQFLARVKRQAGTQAYQLAFLEADGTVVAVAGFRFIEMLAWGRAVYVDDLVTTADRQGEGFGARLLRPAPIRTPPLDDRAPDPYPDREGAGHASPPPTVKRRASSGLNPGVSASNAEGSHHAPPPDCQRPSINPSPARQPP